MQVVRAILHVLGNPSQPLAYAPDWYSSFWPHLISVSPVWVSQYLKWHYIFRHTNSSLSVLQEEAMVIPRISLLRSLDLSNDQGNREDTMEKKA